MEEQRETGIVFLYFFKNYSFGPLWLLFILSYALRRAVVCIPS